MQSSRTGMAFLVCLSAWGLSACGGAQQQAAVPETASPYQPSATFQDIMDAAVDGSADYMWNAVSTIVDETGVHENQPRTDAEWHEFRRRAILLAESANLLSVPGRRVSNGGKTLEDGESLPVAEIQQRLDNNHAALVGFAGALREVSLKLVDAADKRDVARIFELGGELDEVCEACHKVFWYPDAEVAPTK